MFRSRLEGEVGVREDETGGGGGGGQFLCTTYLTVADSDIDSDTA